MIRLWFAQRMAASWQRRRMRALDEAGYAKQRESVWLGRVFDLLARITT